MITASFFLSCVIILIGVLVARFLIREELRNLDQVQMLLAMVQKYHDEQYEKYGSDKVDV